MTDHNGRGCSSHVPSVCVAARSGELTALAQAQHRVARNARGWQRMCHNTGRSGGRTAVGVAHRDRIDTAVIHLHRGGCRPGIPTVSEEVAEI